LLNVTSFKLPKPAPKEIANPGRQENILKEIEILRKEDYRLLQSKNYEVFLVTADKIPQILHELGRLREITFRAVGEGTNNSLDLDKYDQYYHHMFLWDDETKQIAGAYRMGLGSEIFPKYGLSGFYLQELFRFEPELNEMLSK